MEKPFLVDQRSCDAADFNQALSFVSRCGSSLESQSIPFRAIEQEIFWMNGRIIRSGIHNVILGHEIVSHRKIGHDMGYSYPDLCILAMELQNTISLNRLFNQSSHDLSQKEDDAENNGPFEGSAYFFDGGILVIDESYAFPGSTLDRGASTSPYGAVLLFPPANSAHEKIEQEMARQTASKLFLDVLEMVDCSPPSSIDFTEITKL